MIKVVDSEKVRYPTPDRQTLWTQIQSWPWPFLRIEVWLGWLASWDLARLTDSPWISDFWNFFGFIFKNVKELGSKHGSRPFFISVHPNNNTSKCIGIVIDMDYDWIPSLESPPSPCRKGNRLSDIMKTYILLDLYQVFMGVYLFQCWKVEFKGSIIWG